MVALIAQVAGVLVFLILTVALGILLRRKPEPACGESLSRSSHAAFWLGLALPWAAGIVYPGPSALDTLAGLSPLPGPLWMRTVIGGPALIVGMSLMRAAMSGLGRRGKGAPAFKLTTTVVASGVYARARNPMALGYYTACIGGAVISGSTWMLLYSAAGVIPAHLLNLKLFEELELSLRYGESYEQYRQAVPFLIPRLRAQ